MGHYDPYLVAYLDGRAGRSFAAQSLDVITRLNEALRSAYAGAGIPMADVAGVFDMNDATPAVLPDGEPVPRNVARTLRADLGVRHRSAGAEQAPQRTRATGSSARPSATQVSHS